MIFIITGYAITGRCVGRGEWLDDNGRRCYRILSDGVIHDTHNPSERGTTIYPPGYPLPIPKGARRLDNGNGWAYSPERCVYGYWSKPC